MLTLKQKKFIKEYLKDLNGTKAAVRAGYSKRSAKQQGSRLLTNDDLLKELKTEIENLNKKTNIELESVLSELKTIAFSDITDYLDFDDNGIKIQDSKKIEKNKLRAIESIQISESKNENLKRLKLHSKVNALDRLLDYIELTDPKLKDKNIIRIIVEKRTMRDKKQNT